MTQSALVKKKCSVLKILTVQLYVLMPNKQRKFSHYRDYSDRCLKCNDFGHWAKDCPQNQNGAQQKTFPGAQYNYMYPMVPQVPMAPVAMPSNGIQVPMQGPNTAALGQITDVMMQLNEVELQDNPVFMELIEEEIMEEAVFLN